MKKKPPILIQNDTLLHGKADRQCNCACSDSSLKPVSQESPVDYRFSELRKNPELRCTRLDDDYFVGYIPPNLGSVNSIAVINDASRAILSAFDRPNVFENNYPTWKEEWGIDFVNTLLTNLAELKFLCVPNLTPLPVVDVPRVLEAWLHVTDRCNLRCHYCFLPHEHLDMSPEIGQASIDAIFRSALANNYPEVKIKFAGGEAMLRFPFVLELHEYAQELGKRYNISVDSIILTNGTLLTTEKINAMLKTGLRLMISLDGLGDGHDQQRPYAGGRSSSSDITRGIDLALQMRLIPHISITVSNLNADKLADLLEWVLKRELQFSINFYRENIFSNAYRELLLSEEKIIAGMRAAFKAIERNLPRHSLLPSLVDLADLSSAHLRTCGVGQSYLVFNNLGQVSKCHMQMNKPITSVKAEDPLAFIRADTLGIQNISVDRKEGCNSCEWRYWCSGGCPLATHRSTGRYDVKSPNCNIYKTLYPEVILLEGQRLLKWYKFSLIQ